MKALKIILVLALCLSVLMVAGCKSESKKNEDTDKTPETTLPAGGETTAPEGEEDPFKNPEGDPFEDTDVAADPDDGVVEGPSPTEPPVGVQDGEDGQEDDADFDVDFGDFFG